MTHTALPKKSTKSNGSSTKRPVSKPPHDFLVCVSNEGYLASLERRKIYRRTSDPQAEARQLVRIIDESGEDYLYPSRLFQPIVLPKALRTALAS